MNVEVKFIFFLGGAGWGWVQGLGAGSGGGGGGVGWGSGWWGVMLDVNAILGVGCDGGFVNERRSEVFVKIKKKNLGGGGWVRQGGRVRGGSGWGGWVGLGGSGWM